MKLAPPSDAFPASEITILISGFFKIISSILQHVSPSFSLDVPAVPPDASGFTEGCGSTLKSEFVARYRYAGASSEDDVGGRLSAVLPKDKLGLCVG